MFTVCPKCADPCGSVCIPCARDGKVWDARRAIEEAVAAILAMPRAKRPKRAFIGAPPPKKGEFVAVEKGTCHGCGTETRRLVYPHHVCTACLYA